MIDPRVRVSEHLEEWALVLTDGEDIVAALTFYPPDELASQHQLGTIHMMIMTRMMAERFRSRQGLIKGPSGHSLGCGDDPECFADSTCYAHIEIAVASLGGVRAAGFEPALAQWHCFRSLPDV